MFIGVEVTDVKLLIGAESVSEFELLIETELELGVNISVCLGQVTDGDIIITSPGLVTDGDIITSIGLVTEDDTINSLGLVTDGDIRTSL